MILSLHCAQDLVKFRHKKHFSRVSDTSWFGLKNSFVLQKWTVNYLQSRSNTPHIKWADSETTGSFPFCFSNQFCNPISVSVIVKQPENPRWLAADYQRKRQCYFKWNQLISQVKHQLKTCCGGDANPCRVKRCQTQPARVYKKGQQCFHCGHCRCAVSLVM